MATPQMPETLKRTLERMAYDIRLLQQRSPYLGTGLSAPAANTTQVDGNLVVLGNFTAFGKVSNDALVNPTAPGAIYSSLTNYGLTTTLTNIKTVTITVPAGFTQAAVSIVARVYAINPRTTGGYDGLGGDYLYGQANIAGYNGYALPLAVSGSGGSGTNISPFSTVLTGLTGGSTFTVQIAASTNYASWAANASNTAEVSGSILWFR